MATKSRLSKLKDKVAKKLPKLPKLPKLNRAEKLAALGTAVSVGTAIYTLSQQNGSGSNRSANVDGSLTINKDELIKVIKSDTTLQNLLRGATGATGANGVNGANGAAGANGVNGNKIYAVSTLPSNSNDVQIYQNGDLMLNTSTGILYEKSGLTPAQFLIQNSQQGTQGIVLANVVFLTKGNLKGADGTNGAAGDSIIVMSADPTDSVLSKVGDLYLNTTSGTLYQRSGITQAQFYATGQQGIVLPNSIWIRKGNLKGQNGDKGYKILSGTGNFSLSSEDNGKIIIVPKNSTINSVSLNDISTGDFLLYNFRSEIISITKTNETPTAAPIAPNKGLMISVSDSTFTSVEIGSLSNSNFVDKEIPSGLINGSNNTYTLSNLPILGSVHLYVNGLLMNEGVGNDYTISGDTITMLSTLNVGEKIRVSYRTNIL